MKPRESQVGDTLEPPPTSGETIPPSTKHRLPIVPALIIAGVLCVGFAGQSLYHRSTQDINHVPLTDTPKGVSTITVSPARYRPSRRYVGTIEPWVEARVGPQLVSAYVSTVLVRPGAIVHHGDVIATLDCREASAASRAIALQARALEARQVALASQAARMTGLLDGGFVAPNEVEQRQAESSSEQARLLAARAQLLGTSLTVNDCVLRAPFDGEIGARMVDPGAFVRPGSAIVAVVDRNTVRVTADVPETDYNVVAPGTPVRMNVVATGTDIEGSISRRSPSADASTRTLHIEIDLPNPGNRLPAQTTAEINIDVGEPVSAAEIPLMAANVRGRRANVFVVEGSIARARTLAVLGERGGSLFLDPSLAAGTQVVTEGRTLLEDGDHVLPRHVQAPTAPSPNPQEHGR